MSEQQTPDMRKWYAVSFVVKADDATMHALFLDDKGTGVPPMWDILSRSTPGVANGTEMLAAGYMVNEIRTGEVQ